MRRQCGEKVKDKSCYGDVYEMVVCCTIMSFCCKTIKEFGDVRVHSIVFYTFTKRLLKMIYY